jgi:hypothetical protein
VPAREETDEGAGTEVVAKEADPTPVELTLVVVNPEYIMASDEAVTWLEHWGGGNASLNWNVQER